MDARTLMVELTLTGVPTFDKSDAPEAAKEPAPPKLATGTSACAAI